MKLFYPITHFQFSTLTSKPLSLLVAIILFTSTASAQKGIEPEAALTPETVYSFLPGTLVDWTVKSSKNKVVLGWTTTVETNTLHFTVEKSFNGVEYTDAAMVAAAGNSNSRKQYACTDKLSQNAGKNIFYRLKMVDKDANVKYSDVRTIRAGAQEEVKLEVYPNPAVSDLKLTVGASWVNQKILVQVYNINGILVKTKVNERAKETESLTVADLPKGMYVVKISSGATSSVLRFMKS